MPQTQQEWLIDVVTSRTRTAEWMGAECRLAILTGDADAAATWARRAYAHADEALWAATWALPAEMVAEWFPGTLGTHYAGVRL
jgi:hypothetical protein